MKITYTQSQSGAWWYHVGAMYSLGGFATREEAVAASEKQWVAP